MVLGARLQGGEQMNPLDNSTEEQSGPLNTSPKTLQRTQESTHATDTVHRPYLASDLPFDIIFLICLEYLTQETPKHPVETLLLVCKSWHQAALSSSRKWSTFKMHSSDFRFWSYCVPRRLDRCSPDTLLDIEIEFDGSQTIAVSEQCTIILEYLIGSDGQFAWRWHRFVVCSCGIIPSQFVEPGTLRFPTPNLEELELINVRINGPAFPFTPSLKFYSTYNVWTPIPNLRTTTEVSICTEGTFEMAIAIAVNLVMLRLFSGLGNANGYHLSNAYPHLTHLRLPEGLKEDSLGGLSAPALQELHLDFTRGSEFRCVVACEGLPLAKLKKASIESGGKIRDRHGEDYLDGARMFLRAVSHVEVLGLLSVVTRAIFLKLLASQCEELYQDHDVIISAHGYETNLGRGEERQYIIDKFRRVGIMIPCGRWMEIFEILRWYLPSHWLSPRGEQSSQR